jgi:Protein of unknown function (DUF4038)/Putative collagen-binding domain of a collagenase
MKKLITFLSVLFILTGTDAQIKVSANKRYLVKADGTPFFWLGDTAWELFHRLNREQAAYYLKRRADQGYTVVQAVALAEFDGLHVPNPYGDLPLLYDDPNQPNEAYFKHVDYIIDKAAENNITIAFLPTWGDKVMKSTWGKGPEIFTPENARRYGQWLGKRYKDKKNIIWILGGDRNPQNETHLAIWRAMADGVLAGVGDNDKALLSFHPQPNDLGAGEYFHNDNWLDFNMFQTGHCRDTRVFDKIQASYNRAPVKPVIDGEPIYEDHPVCFNANDLGISNAYDVRKSAYLDLFAGAFGHTYGCHDIWQFYSPYREAVNGPKIFWQEAMELPGANQMKFVRKLMESRPILERVPDQSLIVEHDLPAAERIQATRGNDYAFIYSAAGKSFTVILGKITGTKLNITWYNPRNGEIKKSDQVTNTGQQKFTPPTSGYGQDWVLILDDVSKNYSLL